MRNRLIILSVVLLSLSSCTLLDKLFDTKTEEPIEQEAPNYFVIVKQKEAEFANMPDSLRWKGGSGYKDLKKFQDFWRTRVDENGSFEPYLKMRSEKFTEQQAQSGARSTDTWRELGYIDIPSGTNPSNGGTASGGGPIEFIEIFEPSTNYILAGSTQGGLFQSTNYGTTWDNIGSDTKWTHSGCVWAQYHPTNHQTIFAISGMGGGNEPFWIGHGGGIMRTKDGGTTWEKIGDQQNFGWIFSKLLKFVINPNNPNEIYLATCYGLYKTTNALAAANSVIWQKVNNIEGYIYDIEFTSSSNSNPNRLVITYAYDTSPHMKNYPRELHQFRWVMSYSDNGGTSWTNVNSVGMPDVNNTQYMTIETSKDTPNTIYTLHIDTNSRIGYLYKYNFATNSWSSASYIGPISHGQGHSFAVSDLNANKIAVGCCGTNNGRYKISLDGGNNWNFHNYINKYKYHVDVEDFEFDPATDELYMTNHGGVCRASDTNAYENWVSKNVGLGVSTVTGFSISLTDPSLMLAGLYHGGTIITHNSNYTPIWQPQWKTIRCCDGGGNLITDNYIFVSTQESLCRSNNLGNSYQRCVYPWSNLAQLSPSRTIGLVTWIMKPVKNSQTNTIYVQGAETDSTLHVIRSDDFGDNWEVISDISSFNTNPGLSKYAIWEIIPAPSNKDVLYINTTCEENGVSKHRIYKTTNATAPASSVGWTEVIVPYNNIPISDVEVDFNNHETIYITYGNDFGNNNNLVFELNPNFSINHTNNLNNLSAVDLELIEGTNNEMYLLTDVGVYVKNNTNNNWRLHGVGLPHVRGADNMRFDYNAHKLRVALDGRGIWEINPACPNNYDLVETGTYSTNVFKEAENNITSTAIVPNGKSVKYRAGNQIDLNNGFQAQPGSEFQAVILPCRD